MGFLIFSEFFQILRETLKIFFRTGKLIPAITLLSIFVNSIILLSYLFCTKLLIFDLSSRLVDLVPDSSVNSNGYYSQTNAVMKDDLRLFVVASLVFSVAISFASLLFGIATILASAANLSGKQLYAKELVSMVRKSWRRALVTFITTSLLSLGYKVLIVLIVLPLELILPNSLPGKLSPFSIIVIVLTTILYLQLAVVWTLALVVSVLEQKSGYKALWKASELSKGLRLEGFLLMLLFGGLSFAVYQVWGVNVSGNLEAMIGAKMFLFVLSIAIIKLIIDFNVISYVALYSEGKKANGDEAIEMRGGSAEYAKLPASSDFP